MHRFRHAALGAIAAGLCGCAMTQNVAPPVTAAMVAASDGHSAEVLKEGRRLFAGRCTSCHAADPVASRSVAEWHRIVDDMADRSKLTAADRSALLAYISAAR